MPIDSITGAAQTGLARQLHLTIALETCRQDPERLSLIVLSPDFRRSFPHLSSAELYGTIRRILATEDDIAAFESAPVNYRGQMQQTRAGQIAGLDRTRTALIDHLCTDDGTQGVL